MASDRNIVQELRLLGSLDCPYGCDEVGNPAADVIEELRTERDASRLIIIDLTAEVDRLRAAGDRLAAAVNAVACSGPRDEMAELTAAYIDWEASCGR